MLLEQKGEESQLPELQLYERLIDDGIAAADARAAPSTMSPPGGWPSAWPPGRDQAVNTFLAGEPEVRGSSALPGKCREIAAGRDLRSVRIKYR